MRTWERIPCANAALAESWGPWGTGRGWGMIFLTLTSPVLLREATGAELPTTAWEGHGVKIPSPGRARVQSRMAPEGDLGSGRVKGSKFPPPGPCFGAGGQRCIFLAAGGDEEAPPRFPVKPMRMRMRKVLPVPVQPVRVRMKIRMRKVLPVPRWRCRCSRCLGTALAEAETRGSQCR